MLQYLFRVAVTSLIIVTVAETAKRSTLWAALIASLPLTSLLAFAWLYADTHDAERVAALSHAIFWLVLPSLALFLILPFLLRLGWGFLISLGLSSAATVIVYLIMLWLLGRIGIRI
ncbi:DUF3147 family protein [Candidatus Methylomicrobium oryzae]|jgi:hypothetical protein|uniref:DUF3147 family protein n=1 Tax=Candidatus Methylomicrobium oryzae TaxID=2802053 RepID=UPI0019217C84|nr:DUF3147 family protein [Methylomicrobium sp. RS1]MBL1262495.1 DUF3147 family protein [Methylomicrobium sp. RS1]